MVLPLLRARGRRTRRAAVAALAAVLAADRRQRAALSPARQTAACAPTCAGRRRRTRTIAALARHLEQHPQDLSGWLQLGAAYSASRASMRWRCAAYERANRLAHGGNADALAGIGEAMLLSGDAAQAEQAREFFERALQLDPNSPKALFYGALIAYRAGQLRARARRFRGACCALVAAGESCAWRCSGRSMRSTRSCIRHVDAATAIHLHVTLAPALAGKVPPNASLFVFVRSPDGGPPLAVKRSAVKLPQDVELSAADAMIAGRARAARAESRRWSRASPPRAARCRSSGDLYGQIDYVAGKSGPRALEIDRQSDASGAQPPSPADAATAIRLHVTLAPALVARVPANASLFVFVRAPDGGPPLAVKRSAATLPQDVELSAADAMVAGRAVKAGQKVSVVARISASGSPLAQQGDLYGQIDYVAGQSGPSALTIDRRQ